MRARNPITNYVKDSPLVTHVKAGICPMCCAMMNRCVCNEHEREKALEMLVSLAISDPAHRAYADPLEFVDDWAGDPMAEYEEDTRGLMFGF